MALTPTSDVIDCVNCGAVLWTRPRSQQQVEPAATADGTDITLSCPACGKVNVLADWSMREPPA